VSAWVDGMQWRGRKGRRINTPDPRYTPHEGSDSGFRLREGDVQRLPTAQQNTKKLLADCHTSFTTIKTNNEGMCFVKTQCTTHAKLKKTPHLITGVNKREPSNCSTRLEVYRQSHAPQFSVRRRLR
jgi:hypothetical protein